MGETINAASLQTLVNETVADLPNTTCEEILNQAINLINLEGQGQLNISTMQGTAGTKSLTVQSKEKGAIMQVAVAIYANNYKAAGSQSSSFQAGGIGLSESASTGTGTVEMIAKEAAKSLLQFSWSRAII